MLGTTALLLIVVCSGCDPGISERQWATLVSQSTWTPLYDARQGLDSSWVHVGSGTVRHENGHLITIGGPGLLYYSAEKVGRGALKVVYRTEDQHDSGIFVRISERPSHVWSAVNRGYEVQINDAASGYEGTGSVYSFSPSRLVRSDNHGWRTMIILLGVGKILVYQDGREASEFRDSDPFPPRKAWFEPLPGRRPDVGYVGIQNNSEQDTVYFREVSWLSWKELPRFVHSVAG